MEISRRQFNTSLISLIASAYLPKGYSQNENSSKLLIPTFLGNDQRKFYGYGTPNELKEIKKFNLGSGKTRVRGKTKTWSGAGWTGQPTLVEDKGKKYLVIGAYDHNLRKIDFETNEEIFKYKFDDVIKGSSTVYLDKNAEEENKIVILQGSRAGLNNSFHAEVIPSFRAVSFRTGKELWKLNLKKTLSYSRDNDSSAINLGNGELFNAGENAIGYFIDSDAKKTELKNGILQPIINSEVKLYEDKDASLHKGEITSESSPARLEDKLFISSGSGHIYGIDINKKEIIWDYYIGSDLEGTISISDDKKLFCSIEKQFIPGKGGILKLNPSKKPEESVEWFLPTENKSFALWNGGVIGSIALNDLYSNPETPKLFASLNIDGNIYIGSQHETTGEKVESYDKKSCFETPKILFKENIGASISTPIFTNDNKLVAATYNGVYLFQLNFSKSKDSTKNSTKNSLGENINLEIEQKDHFKPGNSFESTPIVWEDRIMVCSRDGFLYTLG